MTDEQMAERIARAQFGQFADLWPLLPKDQQIKLIEHWRGVIYKIRAAGLAVVEAEEGR